MSEEVTNSQLYGVLLGISKDIGGLKATSDLTLEGLKNHNKRIGELETARSRQRGFVSALTLFGSVVGSALGWTVHKLLGH